MATVDLWVMLMFVLVRPKTAPQTFLEQVSKNVYEIKQKWVSLPPARCTILAEFDAGPLSGDTPSACFCFLEVIK